MRIRNMLMSWRQRSISPSALERHRAETLTQAERERIARELHDTLLQGVQAMALQLDAWARDPRLPVCCRVEMTTLAQQGRAIAIEGRDRILNLRRSGEQTDFLATLEDQVTAVATNQTMALNFRRTGRERPLTSRASASLVAIAREAVINAFSHARGSVVHLIVDFGRRGLTVRVIDDGCGIEKTHFAQPRQLRHFGLLGMLERAQDLDAELRVRRHWRGGTEVRLWVPDHCAYLSYREVR
jgi:signal transduction histidine kinase